MEGTGDGTRQIFIGTHLGQGIRFAETDVRPTGRDTTGVWGISLKKKEDYVVEMEVVEEHGHLLTVTEKGYGKRSEASEYRFQARGGSGVINIRVTEKNGPVAGIKSVTDVDQLLLITQSGMLIRIKVKDIRETGRAAQAVRLIYLVGGDRVVAVAKLAEPDDTDDDTQATLPGAEPEPKAPGAKSGGSAEGTPFLDEEE